MSGYASDSKEIFCPSDYEDMDINTGTMGRFQREIWKSTKVWER